MNLVHRDARHLYENQTNDALDKIYLCELSYNIQNIHYLSISKQHLARSNTNNASLFGLSASTLELHHCALTLKLKTSAD